MGRERVCSTVFFLNFYGLLSVVSTTILYIFLYLLPLINSPCLSAFLDLLQFCLFNVVFFLLFFQYFIDPLLVDLQTRPAYFSQILLFRYAYILSLLSIFRNSLLEPSLTVDNCFGTAKFSSQSVVKNLCSF